MIKIYMKSGIEHIVELADEEKNITIAELIKNHMPKHEYERNWYHFVRQNKRIIAILMNEIESIEEYPFDNNSKIPPKIL